jgi:hypothetical protein
MPVQRGPAQLPPKRALRRNRRSLKKRCGIARMASRKKAGALFFVEGACCIDEKRRR